MENEKPDIRCMHRQGMCGHRAERKNSEFPLESMDYENAEASRPGLKGAVMCPVLSIQMDHKVDMHVWVGLRMAQIKENGCKGVAGGLGL